MKMYLAEHYKRQPFGQQGAVFFMETKGYFSLKISIYIRVSNGTQVLITCRVINRGENISKAPWREKLNKN